MNRIKTILWVVMVMAVCLASGCADDEPECASCVLKQMSIDARNEDIKHLISSRDAARLALDVWSRGNLIDEVLSTSNSAVTSDPIVWKAESAEDITFFSDTTAGEITIGASSKFEFVPGNENEVIIKGEQN